MATVKEAIRKIEVLSCANPASFAALSPYAGIKRLAKGGHLFWDKDTVNEIYFVVDGNISLYKMNNLGEKKVIFVYGAGKMINEAVFQNMPASINCEALNDVQVLCFPREVFLEVMAEDFMLTKAVMDSMAIKIRRLYRQLKNTTGSIRGDKRIAAKLWKLSKDYGTPCQEGIRIDLELTITYLADMLGSKRETVSRQMKILQENGLVIQDKSYFILPDRDALMDYFKNV